MADDKEPMQVDGTAAPGEKVADEANPASSGRPDMQDNAGQSAGGAYPNPHDKKGGNPEDDRGFRGGQSVQGYCGGDNPNATSEED